MAARVFAPEMERENLWFCRFEIEEPIDFKHKVYGVSSMQALYLSLKTLSVYLYGSDYYKNREVGIFGEFGGDLTIPATHMFLDTVPYPF